MNNGQDYHERLTDTAHALMFGPLAIWLGVIITGIVIVGVLERGRKS